MTQILNGNSKPSNSSTAHGIKFQKRINEKTKSSVVNILKGSIGVRT